MAILNIYHCPHQFCLILTLTNLSQDLHILHHRKSRSSGGMGSHRLCHTTCRVYPFLCLYFIFALASENGLFFFLVQGQPLPLHLTLRPLSLPLTLWALLCTCPSVPFHSLGSCSISYPFFWAHSSQHEHLKPPSGLKYTSPNTVPKQD